MSSSPADPDCGGSERHLQPPKVLIISPQPFYEDRGTPIALRYAVTALSDLGFEVDFLAFPVGTDVELARVHLHRTANPLRFRSVPIGLSWRKVFLDFLLFWQARRLLKHGEYQYVHAVEESVFMALWLCRNSSEYLVYDMQSSLPEQLSEHRPFRNRAIQGVLDRIERWALCGVDSVACSAGLAGRVLAAGVKAPVREWWFPVTGQPAAPGAGSALRRQMRIPDNAKVFLYTGSFAGYQGLDTVVAAIPQVLEKYPNTFFVIVGAANESEAALGSRLPTEAQEKLRVVRRQPRDRVPHYVALADFLLLPRAIGRNVPLKLFEYMASGKPIVASRTPPHEALLDSSRAVFFDQSEQTLPQVMLDLIANPDRASRLGTAALKYAEEVLTWQHFVELVGQIYNCTPPQRSRLCSGYSPDAPAREIA
jgi:glycosyltransferase involved in cell wall biosynthesis